MKILVVSNFYPPHYLGGYELGCQDVVNGLTVRGHNVRVLTSTHGVGRPVVEGHVHRELDVRLQWRSGVWGVWPLLRRERQNQRAFLRLYRAFAPDVVYVWNMLFGCASLLHRAVAEGAAVACYVSDSWYADFETIDALYLLLNTPATTWKGRAARAVLNWGLRLQGCTPPRGLPRPRLVQFCSDFLRLAARQSVVPGVDTSVCHWGVDAGSFGGGAVRRPPERFLYAGQLNANKGVHTALAAFLQVAERFPALTLSLAGAGSVPAYEQTLRATAAASPAGSRVQFLGKLPREQLSALYREYDAFLFPSEWDEPFSIALLEAMASGLAVVGTLTGGTGEILTDGETGVTFAAGDAAACAEGIERLLANPVLAGRVGAAAARAVRDHHTLDRMVERVERELTGVARAASPPQLPPDMTNGKRDV